MQLSVDIAFSREKQTFLSAQFSIKRQRPQIVVLFGPSGAGKSRLLHSIAGIAHPTSGSITQGDICWFDSEKQISLPPQYRSIGLLFQDYSLFPHLNVFKNIAYGLPRDVDAQATVKEWLKRFRLEEKGKHFPHLLSGGERQRVALAQALAPKPSLVLLDEPFSALDRPIRKELLREVRKWLPSNGVSAIVVLHDLDDAICLGDELIVLSNGKVLQQGKPEEIASHPASSKVAEILGVENLLSGYVLSVLEGELLLEVGKGKLHVVGAGQIGDPYSLSIRAQDILLEKGVLSEGRATPVGHVAPAGLAAPSSARNRLSGRVIEVVPVGLTMAVRMDCGFPLTAKITKRSAEDMNLTPGDAITAVIKASSIHLIPR